MDKVSSGSAEDTVADAEVSELNLAHIDPDGMINGTDVSAYRIAALVEGGMSSTDVLRDYPNLNGADVEQSVAYAKANPIQGRPYPVRTVKSVLREGHGGLARAFAAARAKSEA